MQPRLTSSTKWTLFPKEYLEQIKSVLDESYKDYLSKGEFIVEGKIYREELLLRIGFLEKGRLRQINFEASIEYTFEKDNVIDSINQCFDCCSSMLGEYLERTMSTETTTPNSLFESENIEVNLEDQMNLPYTWTLINFNEREIHIQFSTVNSFLENQANALLGDSSEFMVVEDVTEEYNSDQDDNIKKTTKDGRNLFH